MRLYPAEAESISMKLRTKRARRAIWLFSLPLGSNPVGKFLDGQSSEISSFVMTHVAPNSFPIPLFA